MPSFVRKNELLISGKFCVEGSDAQPSSATALLSYRGISGRWTTTTINLSSSDGIWSGTWDSSAAQEGPVDWVVYSSGGVIAATQGRFFIDANKANTV